MDNTQKLVHATYLTLMRKFPMKPSNMSLKAKIKQNKPGPVKSKKYVG